MTRNTNNNNETRPKKTGFLFAIKWVLSFVHPIRIESHESADERLELLLYLGNFRIDTAKANYSFGNLQTAYLRLFNEWDVEWTEVNNALILGFGAGGVSSLIQERNSAIKQVGLEINPKVVEWYHQYFKQLPNCVIEVADALQYVRQLTPKYDLVVVDVYKDLDVPSDFMTSGFVKDLKEIKTPNGWVLFNKVVSNAQQKSEFDELMIVFSKHFKQVQVHVQMEINRFIIAK